jgi:hypothetical protein
MNFTFGSGSGKMVQIHADTGPRTLTLRVKLLSSQNKIRNKRNDTFMVGPISPPGMEKSVGRMIHFCIRWAFDVALRLYLGT